MIPESYKSCECWGDMASAVVNDDTGANHNPALMTMIKSPMSPLPLALVRTA